MRIPVIRGIIDRRILVNFHIDPKIMAKNLPPPFRPKLINGYAVAGICLIRLKKIRPRFLPLPWGISSENAAHRVAVEWEENGITKEGVYIPRRDTNSRLNTWAGGNVFPGEHHFAKFTVNESKDYYSVGLKSNDGITSVQVSGKLTNQLSKSSVFTSVNEASQFFELGALGYSDTNTKGRYDGLELRCKNWHLEPIEVEKIESSYFENKITFPSNSVHFDCALLMRDIHHEWHSHGDLCIPATRPN